MYYSKYVLEYVLIAAYLFMLANLQTQMLGVNVFNSRGPGVDCFRFHFTSKRNAFAKCSYGPLAYFRFKQRNDAPCLVATARWACRSGVRVVLGETIVTDGVTQSATGMWAFWRHVPPYHGSTRLRFAITRRGAQCSSNAVPLTHAFRSGYSDYHSQMFRRVTRYQTSSHATVIL
jgi:hypothetical protein